MLKSRKFADRLLFCAVSTIAIVLHATDLKLPRSPVQVEIGGPKMTMEEVRAFLKMTSDVVNNIEKENA